MKLNRTFDRYTGVPFLVWADGDKFDNGDIISTTYYGNSEKVIEDYRDFVSEYAKMHNFIGIQIDEPIIPDNEKGYEPLANNAGYMAAYREFAAQRNTELAQLSLPLLDTTPFPAGKVPETETDWVQYIEYQQFKADLMAKHFRNLYDTVKQDGLLTSIVCMDMMARNVMDASYISMGKAMPYMGTDLYDNGSIRESISLQLLKSASSGKVIMWPGAGYSCKTPRNFERSMINGLVWADGIHIWTLLYCAKYRDPNFFWALNDGQIGKTDNGMEITETWDLAYWPIVCDIFGKIESIEPELAGRQSANPVALLLSAHSGNTLALLDTDLAPVGEIDAGQAASVTCADSEAYLIENNTVLCYGLDGTLRWEQEYATRPLYLLNAAEPLLFTAGRVEVLTAPAA